MSTKIGAVKIIKSATGSNSGSVIFFHGSGKAIFKTNSVGTCFSFKYIFFKLISKVTQVQVFWNG